MLRRKKNVCLGGFFLLYSVILGVYFKICVQGITPGGTQRTMWDARY